MYTNSGRVAVSLLFAICVAAAHAENLTIYNDTYDYKATLYVAQYIYYSDAVGCKENAGTAIRQDSPVAVQPGASVTLTKTADPGNACRTRWIMWHTAKSELAPTQSKSTWNYWGWKDGSGSGVSQIHLVDDQYKTYVSQNSSPTPTQFVFHNNSGKTVTAVSITANVFDGNVSTYMKAPYVPSNLPAGAGTPPYTGSIQTGYAYKFPFQYGANVLGKDYIPYLDVVSQAVTVSWSTSTMAGQSMTYPLPNAQGVTFQMDKPTAQACHCTAIAFTQIKDSDTHNVIDFYLWGAQ